MSEKLTGRARYQHLREIGVGGFGVVDACKDLATGSTVAVKTILAAKVDSEAKRLVRELDIMIRLRDRHPNIMSIIDGFVTYPNPDNADEFDVHIVMPLMRGDLHRFTREAPRLPVQDPGAFCANVAVVFAFHTAFALDFLHKCNIVHRDLKPDNILVNLNVQDPFSSYARIGDFGLARKASPTETFYICTRQYRPPEVITNTAKGDASLDIWSFGCVLYELLTGRTLFNMQSSLENGQWVGAKASYQLEAVLDIIGTPSPQDLQHMDPCNVKSYLMKTRPRPSQLRTKFDAHFRLVCDPAEKDMWFDLISACLNFFPTKRPTADDVCRSDLFRRYNIFYSQNVEQHPTTVYPGGATSEVRRENKEKIRRLMTDTVFEEQAAPQLQQFPELRNQALALQYQQAQIDSPQAVHAAVESLRTQIAQVDGATREDLLKLLNYYMQFLPIPATGEDDTMPRPSQHVGDM